MRDCAKALILATAFVVGCAASAPPPKHVEREPSPGETKRRVKLAVLPIESDAFPRLAKALNGIFHQVQVRGVDDYFLSKVTLEVVQLSIECVDSTNECWSAVGRSLTSDRLLLAQIARSPKKRDRSLHLTVTYFDVQSGTALHVAEHAFKSEDEALRDMKDLVDTAVGEAGK
jgi:hypothetical protein